MTIENGIKKIISKDLELLKSSFLEYFFYTLNELKDQEKIVIGLSGGNSLGIFYEELKNNFCFLDEKIREKIYFCFLDERIVSFEDDYSNYKLCKKLFLDELLDKKLIKQKNILLPDFALNNYEENYLKKVKKINIGLFGVGEDGHICSLFPNHNLLKIEKYSYLKIQDSPKQPLNRITISKSMLQDINYSFVFFMGESKINALNNFLDKNIDYTKCPTKLVLDTKNIFLVSNIC